MKKKKRQKNIIQYEFHKWKKQLLIIDIIISIIVIILLGIINADYIVIAVYFLTIPYLIITRRKNSLYHLLIATLVAFVWMIIARNFYGYNQNFISILGINTFPFFAWSIGLFSVYLIYSHYEHILKQKGYARQILLFLIFFIPLLLFIETMGYHVFNIHNLATQQYPGIPICNCIHAPSWMQISYFLLGPIFFIICLILRLENPHHRITKKQIFK